MMSGFFITFEGGEGAGKSTQVQRLCARLESQGHRVAVTREPGGSPRAERIRERLLSGAVAPYGVFAEALMFSAARIDHLDTLIRPALADGTIVLCDRFMDSTRAYQGILKEMTPDIINALESVAVGETRPDLTLILDLAPETGLGRADRRREPLESIDRFEGESTAFHTKLRDAFLEIAAAEPDRCVVIDAALDADEVEKAIWTVVERKLAARFVFPAF